MFIHLLGCLHDIQIRLIPYLCFTHCYRRRTQVNYVYAPGSDGRNLPRGCSQLFSGLLQALQRCGCQIRINHVYMRKLIGPESRFLRFSSFNCVPMKLKDLDTVMISVYTKG